ncbi:lactose-binding lectin l-2-like [Mercenaria mercenaria]|uniref:lactose-binding lectin l-2-like n=1 Tax=Mercenaria mercenaria TaxID=6596 RepID=UPI00234EF05B|nr:lactose-binding lectin l-2-like [Mercenaria mercenaria]
MRLLKRLYGCLTLLTYVYIRECVVTMQNVRYVAVSDSEMKSSVATMFVPSKLSCGLVCEENNECVSFSYNNISAVCRLSDKDPTKEPQEVVASNESTLYFKGCEEGWKLYKHTCYLFSVTWRSWESSKLYCESLGASLVKVESDDEHQFIRNQIQNGGQELFWIGARYNETAGEHRWADGTEMTFNGWGAGRPGTIKGCVDYVWNTGWLWNSHWDCTNTDGPCVCETGQRKTAL